MDFLDADSDGGFWPKDWRGLSYGESNGQAFYNDNRHVGIPFHMDHVHFCSSSTTSIRGTGKYRKDSWLQVGPEWMTDTR